MSIHKLPALLAPFVLGATVWSCNPATISRIGPAVPARGLDCAIEVLDEGQTPDRPHRDVGMVALENCQDYRTEPCRGWLREAACQLGGQVAYPPTEGREHSEFGPVTFRVMVAAYVADLRPDPRTDPVTRALACDPPCREGEVCQHGRCRAAADCAADGGTPSATDPTPERCVE